MSDGPGGKDTTAHSNRDRLQSRARRRVLTVDLTLLTLRPLQIPCVARSRRLGPSLSPARSLESA